MPALFDGVTGLLAEVFGDPVTHTAAGGATATIQSVFRLVPVEVAAPEMGPVSVLRPVWMVPRDRAGAIRMGDVVDPGTGTMYRTVRPFDRADPGVDRFIHWECEEAL